MFLFQILTLLHISLSNRYSAGSILNSFMSVDYMGTLNCDSAPHGQRWSSHKIDRTARRYEMAVSTHGSQTVWITGTSCSQEVEDVQMFFQDLKSLLDCGEKVGADDNYPDRVCISAEPQTRFENRFLKWVRSRHEAVDATFERLDVLAILFSTMYRITS